MLYVGVFFLGATMGALFMAFMAGASRNNQCEDCREVDNFKGGR